MNESDSTKPGSAGRPRRPLGPALAVSAALLVACAFLTMREFGRRPAAVATPPVAGTAPVVERNEPRENAPPPPPSEASPAPPAAAAPYRTSADFTELAMRLREASLLAIEPRVVVPTTSSSVGAGGQYPWKRNIVTTVFAIGEKLPGKKDTTRRTSAWNLHWQTEFGGVDPLDPKARENFRPRAFTPGLNPFYCALPYNDVARGGSKPEASQVIPWFRQTYMKDGASVCRDRWVAIRNPANTKVAYAQWSDCGPSGTDHWQYVFGNEVPRPNANRGTGLQISPAVRDYLELGGMAIADWRFAELREIPKGPWAVYGENNPFLQMNRRGTGPLSAALPSAPVADDPKADAP